MEVDVETCRLVFNAIDETGKEEVPVASFLEAVESTGILPRSDRRLKQMMARLKKFPKKKALSFDDFLYLTESCPDLITRALQGRLAVSRFHRFAQNMENLYNQCRELRGGTVASYTPQLAKANVDHWAVAMCSVDGQRCAFGDFDEKFSIQSLSKPITYCMAMEEQGPDKVHQHIGREPSGRNFNELSLDPDGKPHNALINSGAIMATALIRPGWEESARFEHVTELWARLAGGKAPSFNNALYLSERATADRNFCLAYMMKESGALPDGVDLVKTLEFYFQLSAMMMTAEELSVVAGTLANAGRCPITGEQVFNPTTVRNCLSVMFTCGMYDYSGEFSYRVGLPAKSGVSGGLMIVVPGVAGICTYSPLLDQHNNSLKGVEFCKRLVKLYNFHNFELNGTELLGVRSREELKKQQLLFNLCNAAADGNRREALSLIHQNANPDEGDYDGRTALHLAAAEGHHSMLQLFLRYGVNITPVDRWGGTPEDDARKFGHTSCAKLLQLAREGRLAAVPGASDLVFVNLHSLESLPPPVNAPPVLSPKRFNAESDDAVAKSGSQQKKPPG